MNRLVTVLAAAILGMSAMAASAADKVTLQLKWVTQAQFAGYYVAKDKGIYEKHGLDVTIKPGGLTSRPRKSSPAAVPT
jgi:NitT/TauT family transport system substrate-binding protein